MAFTSQQIQFFKDLFQSEWKAVAANQKLLDPTFEANQDDLKEDLDAVSTELETSMRLRLRNRDALYLKKIEQALRRIQDGTFGNCLECEEEMDLRRLQARPTATLCVHCKEQQEHREVLHIDGHKHKSVGQSMKAFAPVFVKVAS